MVQKQIRELRPVYYEQFQCIGGACEDTCCASWDITIDKKTYQSYKKETHPDLKQLLKVNIQRNRKSNSDFDYAKFKLDDNNACNMLTNEGLCSIQTAIGASSLCNTCQIYPRDMKILDGRSEKSLDISCPEAARLILLNENGIDFVEEYTTDIKQSFSVLQHKNEKLEALFWTNRMFFINALQHRKHSIETRLLIIGLYIKKMEVLDKNEQFQQSESLSKKYLNFLNEDTLATTFSSLTVKYELQYKLFNSFIKNYNAKNIRFKDLAAKTFKQLPKENPIPAFTAIINENKVSYLENDILQFAFENYLVNFTFSKYNEVHLDSIEFFSNLSIQFTILRLFVIGLLSELPMDEKNIINIFQAFGKACSHNTSYINNSNAIISAADYSKAAQAVNIISI